MRNIHPKDKPLKPIIPEDEDRVWPRGVDMSLSEWLAERPHLSRSWVVNPGYDKDSNSFTSHPVELSVEDMQTLGAMSNPGPWTRKFLVSITHTNDHFTITAIPGPKTV